MFSLFKQVLAVSNEVRVPKQNNAHLGVSDIEELGGISREMEIE